MDFNAISSTGAWQRVVRPDRHGGICHAVEFYGVAWRAVKPESDFQSAGELPPFEPVHMLMANLLGSIVCVWAVLRIRDPQQVFGRYDAVGRLLFSAWQAYAWPMGRVYYWRFSRSLN